MGVVMLVQSCVTMVKTLRDVHEGKRMVRPDLRARRRIEAEGLSLAEVAAFAEAAADAAARPHSLPSLMASRRFAPLFWCQFFSAFNDNFLKNALVFLILFGVHGAGGGAEGGGGALVTLAGAAFIAPLHHQRDEQHRHRGEEEAEHRDAGGRDLRRLEPAGDPRRGRRGRGRRGRPGDARRGGLHRAVLPAVGARGT
jgi:hypothetical protein